jgi:prepilin-type N-terminal cleavage/methylation domain-containing protein
MARRPGFTLVELLVSLALLSVLVAFLIPVISAARSAALKVVCTTRLRDLTMACNLHRTEKGTYPLQPGATIDPRAAVSLGPLKIILQPPKPVDMDAAFLNALQPYLKFPEVDSSAASPADLPHSVQCPTVEDADDVERISPAELTFTRPALYTGYAYCVRPKDGLVSAIRILKPKRAASNDMERAVVWADDVHWSMPDYSWKFSHAHPKAKRGSKPLSYADASALLGQHRAYSDGSVEWVGSTDVDLDIMKDRSAARKASLSVFDMFYFWF